MSKTIQALGAPRLSKDSDESTSIERQKAGIGSWADFRSQTTGDTYQVAYPEVVDTDISGAMSPFERPGLGPYLRGALLNTWSVLVVFRLDRLTRSIADFETLWKFLEANGKTLVSISENIDFGTPAGRLMARQFVLFAEYEREMIRARVKSAYDSAQAQGRYPGMAFPFGYRPVKAGKSWRLEKHPVYAPVVSQIASKLLAGESLSAVCRWLEAEGIPTPRNAVREYKGKKPLQNDAHWNTTSLTTIMKSPAVMGEVTVNGTSGGHNAKSLRDETGMAVKRAEPLIDRETWERVKTLLADNAAKKGPMVNRAALLNIAFCGKCGRGLNLTSASWNGKTYYYYRCPNERLKRGCDAKRIPAAELESYAELSLMMRVGSMHITEEIHSKGIDYSTQMAEIAEGIGALSSRMALARAIGQDVSKLEAQRAAHELKLAELADAQTSARPPETKEIELDETWSERWHQLEWPDRSALLRRKEMRLTAERDATGNIRGGWNLGTIQGKHHFSTPETS